MLAAGCRRPLLIAVFNGLVEIGSTSGGSRSEEEVEAVARTEVNGWILLGVCGIGVGVGAKASRWTRRTLLVMSKEKGQWLSRGIRLSEKGGAGRGRERGSASPMIEIDSRKRVGSVSFFFSFLL